MVQTDLWLERSRFQGMILDGVSYGILLVLSIESGIALCQRPRRKLFNEKRWRRTRCILLVYISLTFFLATIGFAANAKYSQMIWIDLRDSSEGPKELIINELNYWENKVALTSNYVMSWMLDILLVFRCIIIWNGNWIVATLMSLLVTTNIAMAVLTLVESSKGAIFANINFQLAFLVISVSTNVIYSVLVAGRLLYIQKRLVPAIGKEHVRVYISVAAMVIESAVLYSSFGLIYVVAYALHSNVTNLIFLWMVHLQAIAQLLIILRIARGEAITQEHVTARQITSIDVRPASPPTIGNNGRPSFFIENRHEQVGLTRIRPDYV